MAIAAALKEIVVCGLAAKAASRSPQQIAAGTGMLVLAGAVFLISVVFLAFAAFTWLATVTEPAVAYLMTFAILLALSGLLGLLGKKAMAGKDNPMETASRDEIGRIVDLVANDLIHELEEPVRENPKTALAAATIAGFLVGDRL